MTRRADILPPPPRRGLSHREAAAYVGVGLALFDRLVCDGILPRSLPYNARRQVWDRMALDDALSAMPDVHGSGCGTPKWNFETETGPAS